MTLSQVGSRRNDAYTAYIDMGAPRQLPRHQGTDLKAQASGKPARARGTQYVPGRPTGRARLRRPGSGAARGHAPRMHLPWRLTNAQKYL